MKLIELDVTDSTNEYIKRSGFNCNVAVTARVQTGGRGTHGRSFSSEEGGLYISFLHIYQSMPADRAFEIMINSCVAVCRTVQKFGIRPRIRWANDVLTGDKKLSGSLIENTLSSGHISRSIVGIGLNVHNALPPELKDIATTLCAESGKKLSVIEVREELVANMQKGASIHEYKSYIDWLGSEVVLCIGEQQISAVALDISPQGRLVCEIGGRIKEVSAGEVSLRLPPPCKRTL